LTREVRVGNRIVTVRVESEQVHIEESTFTVQPAGRGVYVVSDGERRWSVATAGPRDDRWVFVDGHVARLEIAAGVSRARRRSDSHELASQMPATVVRVLVEPGAHVSRGDTLVVLEAMKMELSIRAPRDGAIRAVHVKAGQLVQPNVELLELE